MPTKQNENTESNAQTQYMCMYVSVKGKKKNMLLILTCMGKSCRSLSHSKLFFEKQPKITETAIAANMQFSSPLFMQKSMLPSAHYHEKEAQKKKIKTEAGIW